MLSQSLRACKSLRCSVRPSGRIPAVRVMAFQSDTQVTKPRIKVGSALPLEKTVTILKEGATTPEPVKLSDIFAGKKGVLFGLPGAFTGVCSSKHVPEFKSRRAELQEAGVEVIACASVNDAYVMRAWACDLDVNPEEILMLGDGDASLHKELGLTQELPGLGERAIRYSMYIEDDVIKVLNAEEPGGANYKISGPSHMLEDLRMLQQQGGKTVSHTAKTP